MSDRDDHYAADVTVVGDIIGTVPAEDDDDNPYDHARRILTSGWLRARDARVAAEALEDMCRSIRENEVGMLVIGILRARAAEYRTFEHTATVAGTSKEEQSRDDDERDDR